MSLWKVHIRLVAEVKFNPWLWLVDCRARVDLALTCSHVRGRIPQCTVTEGVSIITDTVWSCFVQKVQ